MSKLRCLDEKNFPRKSSKNQVEEPMNLKATISIQHRFQTTLNRIFSGPHKKNSDENHLLSSLKFFSLEFLLE